MNSSHELELETTYRFSMGEDLRVIGIEADPKVSLYEVIITYMNDNDDFQVGKVLQVDLQDPSSAKTFKFMSSKTSRLNNTIKQRIFDIHMHDDHYIYGGQANYLESTTVTSSLDIDWTSSSKYYGYFEVYTNNENCVVKSVRDARDFGPDKSSDFRGDLEALSWKIWEQTE